MVSDGRAGLESAGTWYVWYAPQDWQCVSSDVLVRLPVGLQFSCAMCMTGPLASSAQQRTDLDHPTRGRVLLRRMDDGDTAEA